MKLHSNGYTYGLINNLFSLFLLFLLIFSHFFYLPFLFSLFLPSFSVQPPLFFGKAMAHPSISGLSLTRISVRPISFRLCCDVFVPLRTPLCLTCGVIFFLILSAPAAFLRLPRPPRFLRLSYTELSLFCLSQLVLLFPFLLHR